MSMCVQVELTLPYGAHSSGAGYAKLAATMTYSDTVMRRADATGSIVTHHHVADATDPVAAINHKS